MRLQVVNPVLAEKSCFCASQLPASGHNLWRAADEVQARELYAAMPVGSGIWSKWLMGQALGIGSAAVSAAPAPQTAMISTRCSMPRKSSMLRVTKGRFAASAVAAINKSTARGPRALRRVAMTAA